MPLYQRGSTGPEVRRVQDRLIELGHYRGPLGGIYGGGTESAVKAFQRAEELRDVQVEAAERLDEGAVELAGEFDLRSERAVALMFGIEVQNGSIPGPVRAQIRSDFERLDEEEYGIRLTEAV